MRRLLLILLLLLPALALGQKIEDPREVSQISMSIFESGEVLATDVEELDLRVYYFPRPTNYSSVSFISTTPNAELKEKGENTFYLFAWENPAKERYLLSSRVSSSIFIKQINSKVQFPYQQIPLEFDKYLSPTGKIDSDNLLIKKKANELAMGEDDAYKVIFKLANFTNKEVKYNLEYYGKQLKASDVLEVKEGVCAEFSTLFLALARSLGIPARAVSGVAYGNVYGEKFSPHAWVEVYLPEYGWIPVDPTFGEVGWVDPAHIYMQVSDDVGSKTLEYSWRGGSVEVNSPEVEVEVENVASGLPKYIESRVWIEKETIGIGSYNIIWLELKNTQPFYIASEAYLTKSPEIIGENQQAFLLEPFGSQVIRWIVKVPEDLDEGYKYTYWIEAKVLFGESQESLFYVVPGEEVLKVDEKIKGESEHKKTFAKLNVQILHPELAFVGEEYNITIRIKNIGTAPEEKFSACLDGACSTEYIGIGEEKNIVFTQHPAKPGLNSFVIRMRGESFTPAQQLVEVEVRKRSLLEKILAALYKFMMALKQLIK